MKEKSPPDQLGTYCANAVADKLREALECDDEVMGVLTEFHEEMSSHRKDSYVRLEVVGIGELHEAFVWWMDDDSVLLVGWKDEEELLIAVLPPDTRFMPGQLHDGKVVSVH